MAVEGMPLQLLKHVSIVGFFLNKRTETLRLDVCDNFLSCRKEVYVRS